MLRSVTVSVLQAGKIFTSHDCQRLVQRSLPAMCHCARSLHLSASKFLDDSRVKPEKGRFRARSTSLQKNGLSAEMKQAVVNVAKSLPGDWTKTAEELLTRLQQQESPELASKDVEQQKQAAEPDVSLLKTLEIGRSFHVSKSRHERMQQPASCVEGDDLEMKVNMPVNRCEAPVLVCIPHWFVEGNESCAAQSPRRWYFGTGRAENYELYQMPRLGIFDAKKLRKNDQQQLEPSESEDLWVKMDAEQVRRVRGAVPRNSFEEMVQWTKEGKLWRFPIDNEADMVEERKYKFQDHVFLERHLSEFPSKGPVRKFMELVTLGLSSNPWITVPEKIEHIRWFADYFREKQDILEDSIGEEGRMKKPDELVE